eukprot:PhF_6_TR43167/c0_g1_i1/m.66115
MAYNNEQYGRTSDPALTGGVPDDTDPPTLYGASPLDNTWGAGGGGYGGGDGYTTNYGGGAQGGYYPTTYNDNNYNNDNNDYENTGGYNYNTGGNPGPWEDTYSAAATYNGGQWGASGGGGDRELEGPTGVGSDSGVVGVVPQAIVTGGGVVSTVVPPAVVETKKTGFLRFFKNHITSVCLSVPFKIHMMLHFYAAYVLVILIGYNTLYATVYRMYSLPVSNVAAFWQTMAFFCLLIAFHFFFGSFLTLIMEYAKEFWLQKPTDTFLWGIKSKRISHSYIYFVLVTMYLYVPLLWSICYTIARHANVLYFFEYFYFLTMMFCLCQIVGAWVWMYWRALVQKNRSLGDRENFFKAARMEIPQDVVKMKWYKNPSVLKEYGMDVPSLNAMMLFTFSGFVLHIALSIVLATDGQDGESKPSEWIGVGVAYFICLWFLREVSTQKHWYRAASLSLIFLIIYSVLALASCGVSGGSLIGVWLVLMAATQGLCLRKRDFYFREEPGATESRPALDGYLCCCRAVLRACCIKYYGNEETEEEKEKTRVLRKERFSLWSDIKTINNFLLFFTIALILLLIFGRQLREKTAGNIAGRTNIAISNSSLNPNVVCTAVPQFSNSTNVLSMVDVALITSLTYSDGDSMDKDFTIWFSHMPSISRIYPRTPVSTSNDIGGTVNAHWVDFYDSNTNVHYILIRSFVATTTWMRDIDLWGDAVVMQIAEIAIPFVRSWPHNFKVDFVDAISFIKKWYGGTNVTDAVEDYVKVQISRGHKVMMLGHGSNGGLAKVVAAKFDLPVVAFNSPGTEYLSKRFGIADADRNQEVNVNLELSFWGYLDKPRGSEYVVHCPLDSEHSCADSLSLASRILEECGDRNGRSIKN